MQFIEQHLQACILALFVSGAMLSTGALLMLRRASKKRSAILDRLRADASAPTSSSSAEQAAQRSQGVRSLVESMGRLVIGGGVSKSLVERLDRAGFHAAGAPAIFLGVKVLSLTVLFFGALVIQVLSGLDLSGALQRAALVGGIGSFVPNLYLSGREARRLAEIRRYLPDATDLLEISVAGGMSLGQAWHSVSAEVERFSPILAEEMDLTKLEIQLGVPLEKAMRNMARRTGVSEVSSFVSMIVQAERFGSSMIDALRLFAATTREAAGRKAEEYAAKMSVRMLVPMALFILPATMIVTAAPAVMQVTEVLTQKAEPKPR